MDEINFTAKDRGNTSVTYRARFAVPSNGVEIWSESEFDDPDRARDMLKPAMEHGEISQYEIWQIVLVTTETLIERHNG